MADRRIAIVAFGMDHCNRGVESNARMMHARLSDCEGIECILIKGSGHKAMDQVVLSVPKRDSLLCRGLGRLRGYNIYWEQVFFMLRLAVHLLAHPKGYDAIYTQEYVHLVGMGKLKQWFDLKFRLVYCEGFVISRPTRLKYADVLQEINRKNYDELREAAEEQGVTMTLLPHFYEVKEENKARAEGLDHMQNTIADFKGEGRLLLFVGSTERPEKNFDLLLREFRTLSADYRLLICGECPEEKLSALQSELGERVMHLYVPHEKMVGVYAQADIFVLPALDEPFGISIIEAMYHHLPVILHDTAHSLWVCDDSGQLIDMTSSGALKAHLDSISDLERYKADKGAANRAYFDTHYTWEVLKDRYLALFT